MDLITVDLHCHTAHSRDSLMRPERILERCRRRGIERIAITDHNVIQGALEAAELDPDRVIVGEEILTQEGELLGYFLRERVPPGLPPEEAIAHLRAQGAVISVSHPFDTFRSGSWSPAALDRILPLVDALEVFNARTLRREANRKAQQAARAAGLPGTAGSDAHAYLEVGRAGLQLPAFNSPASMKTALAEAALVGRLSSPLVHLFSSYASWLRSRGRP